MENKLDYFKIGKIVKTKGLRGEVKVYSHTDNIERFLELDQFYIGKDRNCEYHIEKANIVASNMVTIKIKGFDTIESVQKFVNQYIFVRRDNTYELEEDELFIADMIGMKVLNVDGSEIGNLVEVLQYSANDVYVVKNKEGREFLIPATYEIVPTIDTDKKIIYVDPIPGLLD